MLKSLRARTSDEGGFTLIELLVVVLIIGILSAIAIPAFLSQTSKASDSAAKTQVGTLQTTMETYASENNGSYEKVGGTGPPTLVELEAIEPTLKDVSTAKASEPEVTSSNTYEVSSEAVGTHDVYTLKNEDGTIVRSCTVGSPAVSGASANGGGCKAGSW
ncbi:MAG: type IV pilin protein [Solirubrobacteraceae bacterium]